MNVAKLISFNVNGIRSAIAKGFLGWIDDQEPDIICLQEIKLSETQLVAPEFEGRGYHCLWHPAQKKGYSGVAILSKIRPLNYSIGMGIEKYDCEGRVVLAEYDSFVLVTTYFPSGTAGDHRQTFKYEFLEDYTLFIDNLIASSQKPVIICGDVNICHEDIDIHNPKANKNSSGFLPEERKWVSDFLLANKCDTFRFFHPESQVYTWWTYRAGARDKNLGWRIDYFFATTNLIPRLIGASIHDHIRFSDHCPIELKISL